MSAFEPEGQARLRRFTDLVRAGHSIGNAAIFANPEPRPGVSVGGQLVADILELIGGPAPIRSSLPFRPDLALGACRAAAEADELTTAQALAQTAVDFLIGDYDPSRGDPDDAEACIACDKAFAAGDPYYPDASGGFIHAACCGPERESYTGADGGQLKEGEPIPEPMLWRDQ